MPEDSASWYQRKLAQMRGNGAPFQGRAPTQPYQQPVSPYQQNSAPVQQMPAIQQPASPETLSDLLNLQEHGQGPRAGKGAKLNPDPCPNCGGSLYYANLGMKRRGPPPAPHCFNCGYNELFEQGLESNWQAGA